MTTIARLSILALLLPGAASPPPALPPQLDTYVTKYVQLTPAQQTQLTAGQPVTKLLESDPSTEVAVFGAVWVDAPMARYVERVKDIEQFEKGENFRVTKRISTPPRIEDFAAMTLPDDDVADLKACKVGQCERSN